MHELKDEIKLVVTHFFIITVGVLFITSLSNLIFDDNQPISPEFPWQILLTGIIGALPSFIFHFKKEPTRKQFHIRCIIHFIIIETLIMTEGAIFGWYEDFLGVLILFSVILLIYIFVWIYSYIMNMNLAKDINAALKRINENDDEDEN